MPLKTIIVEDETPSRERLKSLLTDYKEIELIGEAENGPDAVNLINTIKPDLVFLDIQLPVYTGFEVIQKIKFQPLIIFVTAFDEYAIKAFEANAVDYLLKPTTPQRLKEAIDRIYQRTSQKQDLLLAIKNIMGKNEYRKRFTVKNRDEILFIPVEDIYWFHAQDKYVFLHTVDKKYLIEETLRNLEDCLDPEYFIRIHKSIIVNLKKMGRIKRKLNGQYQVQLNDIEQLSFKIGRTYLPLVKKKLQF
jgi:DNA-binding LytR/AlgR family response regulator